jgi:hypothetical protein
MKKFLLTIGIYLLITYLLLLALDYGYTTLYSKSVVRNKVQLTLNAPPKHYDVIFIGSSRAENHLIPAMFQDKGLKTYNFGMSGSNLCENTLLLKLFFEKGNTVDTVLLQMDLNFESEAPNNVVKNTFLPFLTINETVYKHYLAVPGDPVFWYRYIPFYRYLVVDSKIGMRELAMTVANKQSKYNSTNGYLPLDNIMVVEEKDKFDVKFVKKNKFYDQIKTICHHRGVKLITFEAPFCKELEVDHYFGKMKKNVPEIYDYSYAIHADSLFSSCGHLNHNGAVAFTNLILQNHFSNKN